MKFTWDPEKDKLNRRRNIMFPLKKHVIYLLIPLYLQFMTTIIPKRKSVGSALVRLSSAIAGRPPRAMPMASAEAAASRLRPKR